MNKIWWIARACLEALCQGLLFVIVIYTLEINKISCIFVLNYSSLSSIDVGIVISMITIICLILANIIFVIIQNVNMMRVGVGNFLIGVVILAFLESIVFIAIIYGVIQLLNYLGFIIIILSNGVIIMIEIFFVLVATNLAFNIIFRAVESKKGLIRRSIVLSN